ncbi:MAG TPA: DUF4838 domain-containing protein [Victivallales bacterium]|nr:DUF4838 domain-containing protein [Victivallales bacterium]
MKKFSIFLRSVSLVFLFLIIGIILCSAEELKNPLEMVLADNGKSLAPVIIPNDATMFTRRAVDDLVDYIGKVGGGKPNIIEGMPDPVPEHAIWVGFQTKLKELFPDTDFDFKNPEEILIKTDGRNLVIVGRDVWDPVINKSKISKEGFQFGNRDVEGFQFEYGTVNAVYSFLQKNLGVRWLWPGKDGEVLAKKDRIAFKPFEFRYHPKIRQRHSIFAHLALFKNGGKPGTDSGNWVMRQRLLLDSLYAPASGHGFGNWYERFYKTHPEYFALQPNGSRSGSDKNPSGAKICESNPAVWDQWIKDVEETVKKYPHRKVFNAAANDGYTYGHCTCEKCRSWDSPEAELRIFIYGPERPKLPALSDRQVTFANNLGRLLKERFPGKDYKVLIHAYGFSRPAPIKAVPADNVIISNVANVFSDPDVSDKNSLIGAKAMDYFDEWAKKTKNQIWRPNTGDPAHWRTGGPPDITGAGKIFKRMAEKDILGISIDMVWFYWATQGPQYYLMAQLAWNPDQQIDEIMDDYYKSGFGPAAEEIRHYWENLESKRIEIQKKNVPWTESFNPGFFNEAYSILDKAAEKVSMSGKEYSYKVSFVRSGLDYLRLNTENQILARQIINSKTADSALKDKMLANWKQIEEISEKFPNSLNKGHVSRNASTGHLSYIHPDADHKAMETERLKKQKREERKANFRKQQQEQEPDLGLE